VQVGTSASVQRGLVGNLLGRGLHLDEAAHRRAVDDAVEVVVARRRVWRKGDSGVIAVVAAVRDEAGVVERLVPVEVGLPALRARSAAAGNRPGIEVTRLCSGLVERRAAEELRKCGLGRTHVGWLVLRE